MGASPSKLIEQIFEAASIGDFAGFTEALDALRKTKDYEGKSRAEVGGLLRDPSIANPKFKGDSLLHAACRFVATLKDFDAKLTFVNEILSWKTIDINDKNVNTGRTPLHWVCDCDLLKLPRNKDTDAVTFPTKIVKLLLEEGAVCSGADLKLIIDKEGFDPLMLAARCGFTEAVQELVGSGARVGPIDVKNKLNALHFAFPYSQTRQCKTINFVRMLESLLPVADKAARSAVGFGDDGTPVTPFMCALFSGQTLGVYDRGDGGLAVMRYLLKNGINFFEECMSYQVYMTNVLYLKSEKTAAAGATAPQVFDGWRDFGKAIFENRKKITPEFRTLFFDDNATTKQAHPFPWKPCFLFPDDGWNQSDADKSPLYDFGKASPLAGAIMLMRLSIFEFLVRENGFKMLLTPIESKIIPGNHLSQMSSVVTEDNEQVLRVVPLYILAAAYVPDESATAFMRVAFESADPESLKEFSAFKSYAGENMADLIKRGDEDFDRLTVTDYKEIPKYSTYDYFYMRDASLTYSFNKKEENQATTNRVSTALVHNEKCFYLFYYSASHVQQFVKRVAFFCNELPVVDETHENNNKWVRRFLSVFHSVECVELFGCDGATVLDDINAVSTYVNKTAESGISELTIVRKENDETESKPIGVPVFEAISSSSILKQSLKRLMIPVSPPIFTLVETDSSPPLPWYQQLVYSLSSLTTVTFNDCTQKQVQEIEEFNRQIQDGELPIFAGRNVFVTAKAGDF